MTDPKAALTRAEVDDLRERMCGDKLPRSYEGASKVAWVLRQEGDSRVGTYPCPFDHRHGPLVWHVGHPPSIERMRVLARYLRFGADDG